MQLKRILVNATNLSGAGPKSLGRSLLPSLISLRPDLLFSVLLPDEWRGWKPGPLPNAQIHYFPSKAGIWNDLERMKQLYLDVPRVARATHADVCLTLGDLSPVGLPCPQVVFLHMPMLVYSRKEMNGCDGWSRAKRLYLKIHFRQTGSKVSYLVVQTDVMAKRVIAEYGMDRRRVSVIPQPVPLHVASSLDTIEPSAIHANSKPVKLIFLSKFYPHKNHEILPEVAGQLRRRGLIEKVQVYTTIDLERCPSAKVKEGFRTFPDVLTNLGPIKPENVASLLVDASACFLPTIVESFGLVYLEAMAAGLPILTSDRDFAHHICDDLAEYFDPFDARSIADCIERFCQDPDRGDYAARAQKRLLLFPKSWDEVAQRFIDLLCEAATQPVCANGQVDLWR